MVVVGEGTISQLQSNKKTWAKYWTVMSAASDRYHHHPLEGTDWNLPAEEHKRLRACYSPNAHPRMRQINLCCEIFATALLRLVERHQAVVSITKVHHGWLHHRTVLSIVPDDLGSALNWFADVTWYYCWRRLSHHLRCLASLWTDDIERQPPRLSAYLTACQKTKGCALCLQKHTLTF